jgi:hypothetical protein
MAVSTTSYFSNSSVGVPQVAGDFNVFDSADKPKLAIGTKIEREDGAVFRYSHFGTAISSAGLVLATSNTSNMVVTNACIVASASSYAMPNESNTIYPNMKGSRYIVLTIASIAADDFQGGYAVICSAGNLHNCGYTYRVKGNTATGDPTSGNIRLELYEKLQAGLNTSTSVVIAGNAHSNLRPAYFQTAGALAGVSMTSHDANDYGWVQSKGIVGCLHDVAGVLVVRGDMVSISTGTNGSVSKASITSNGMYAVPLVGYACESVAVSGNWVPVKLMVD